MDTTMPRRSRRELAGRVLLAVASAAAAAASIAELAGLAEVGQDVAMLAGWRALGLAAFAGLFALLAWRPLGYPGMFELAIGHKLAMTLYALSQLGASTDAGTVAAADGLLTVALVTAYVLVRANRSWSPRRQSPTTVTRQSVRA